MRVVIQRVREASVVVDGVTVAEIGIGFLILLGVLDGDTAEDADVLAAKVAGLRLFRDDEHHMNRSLGDVGGEAIVVSQFTLAGDARKGRRPSFTRAANPMDAEPLVDRFVAQMHGAGVPTQTGRFGADMAVSLVNDGPVTLVVETVDGKVV